MAFPAVANWHNLAQINKLYKPLTGDRGKKVADHPRFSLVTDIEERR